MIRRRHNADGIVSDAVYSDCERYRYALTRTWDSSRAKLLIVMLNPSTATELANDPTIARCQARAGQLGYGAMRICNLFAWRATDPRDLKRATAPEGPDNAEVLATALRWSDAILLGWGVHGAHRNAGPNAIGVLRKRRKPVLHLGLTKDGHPRHPLYVAYATQPQPFN